MKQQQALNVLAQHREEFAAMKIKSLSIFGSVAREESRLDSDLDILIEFDSPVGLFHFARVRRMLSDMLGVCVDLVTPAGLRKEFKDTVMREAIHAV